MIHATVSGVHDYFKFVYFNVYFQGHLPVKNPFQVTEIDEGLLQLKNLKQLTLSANLIKYIDSKRLPKGLEVLVPYLLETTYCVFPVLS